MGQGQDAKGSESAAEGPALSPHPRGLEESSSQTGRGRGLGAGAEGKCVPRGRVPVWEDKMFCGWMAVTAAEQSEGPAPLNHALVMVKMVNCRSRVSHHHVKGKEGWPPCPGSPETFSVSGCIKAQVLEPPAPNPGCRVRELEKARFGKRMSPAPLGNRSPLMRRGGAAVRLVRCRTNPRKD